HRLVLDPGAAKPPGHQLECQPQDREQANEYRFFHRCTPEASDNLHAALCAKAGSGVQFRSATGALILRALPLAAARAELRLVHSRTTFAAEPASRSRCRCDEGPCQMTG